MRTPTETRNDRWPPQIKYIVGNEAAERFSFYGMRSILALYITTALIQSKDRATTVIHFFIFASYFMPLFGAWLSDRFWGRYRTILWISLFYCAGHGVLALSDLFTTVDAKLMCLYSGLGLIAFGAGGIKPCVSAFMGDQFAPDQGHLMRKAYGAFYFSINFGSFFSFLVIPWIAAKPAAQLAVDAGTLDRWLWQIKQAGFTGYGWAFGVPGILMGLATLIFWLGTRHYIRKPPAKETRTPGFFTVFFLAFRNLNELITTPKPVASTSKTGGAMTPAVVLVIAGFLGLYAMVSLLVSCVVTVLGSSHGTFLQAVFLLLPVVLKGTLIYALLPCAVVWGFLLGRNWARILFFFYVPIGPLLAFAMGTFGVASAIQLLFYAVSVYCLNLKVVKDHFARNTQVTQEVIKLTATAVVSLLTCVILPLLAMVGMVFVALRHDVTPIVRTVGWVALICMGLWYLLVIVANFMNRSEMPDEFWKGARGKVDDAGISAARSVAPILAVLAFVPPFWALFDQSNSTWVLQGAQMQPFKFLGINVAAEQMQSCNPLLVMILIPLLNWGLYPLLESFGLRATALRRMSLGLVLTSASYVVVGWLQHRIEAGEAVSLAWQAVPYLILTTGEVLVSTTGLEFAYTQAAPSMKSTIMSFWLLTVALGSLLVTTITQLGGGHGDESVSSGRFYLYAGMTAAVTVLFVLIAARYRYRDTPHVPMPINS